MSTYSFRDRSAIRPSERYRDEVEASSAKTKTKPKATAAAMRVESVAHVAMTSFVGGAHASYAVPAKPEFNIEPKYIPELDYEDEDEDLFCASSSSSALSASVAASVAPPQAPSLMRTTSMGLAIMDYSAASAGSALSSSGSAAAALAPQTAAPQASSLIRMTSMGLLVVDDSVAALAPQMAAPQASSLERMTSMGLSMVDASIAFAAITAQARIAVAASAVIDSAALPAHPPAGGIRTLSHSSVLSA